jgi:putative membrane protein
MGRRKRSAELFSREEKERIAGVVREAESGTIGEIAVVVADHSGRYRDAEVLGGMLVASLVSLIITVIWFDSALWFFISLAFLLYFPGRRLFNRFPLVKMAFVAGKRRDVAVREAALRSFYEKGLHRTREGTGILFYLSRLERKVWVLADRGIHGKIHQNTWNRLAAMVSQGMREGHGCEALLDAVREAGVLLAAHYPVSPGDVNELSDEVICSPGTDCEA